MDVKDIISAFPEESDRLLLNRLLATDRPSATGEQAKTILQMRTVEKLITSLNANSASSDKLANRLNWLTLVIAIATGIGAFATIVQLFK